MTKGTSTHLRYSDLDVDEVGVLEGVVIRMSTSMGDNALAVVRRPAAGTRNEFDESAGMETHVEHSDSYC